MRPKVEFRDPESMDLIREVTVSKNGHPVRRINELERVGSDVYANVWQRDEILRIDPRTGHVIAIIDASGLLTQAEARHAEVLNGIACKPESKAFLLTGKLWPQLFEVELMSRRFSFAASSSGSQRASRFRIVAKASGCSSIRTKPRPNRAAASPVVPLPAKKSSTVSPGSVCTLMIRSRMPSGF